ncbi:MAG: threonine ammonia-lyase [Candidatus Polarisedimenticolia bacterium]
MDFAASGLGPADLRSARAAVAPFIRTTPLVPAGTLSERLGRPVLLKCENLQAGGAFKMRGASHFVARLDAPARARGIITYSSGNHGIAVATAARRAGIRAVVVMPSTVPAVKKEKVLALGAEVHLAGPSSLDRKALAERLQKERELVMIPPFDHPWIVAGQATCGLEILEQCPEAAAILVPVGGGGLLAGIALACHAHRPSLRPIGVEPEGAAKMSASLAAGRPVTLDACASIADGLLPNRPGDLTFAVIREAAGGVVTVGDAAIRGAAEALLRDEHLLVEWSGSVGVAALSSGAARPAGDGPVIVVLSGGNADPLALLPHTPAV